MYTIATPKEKEKMAGEIARGHGTSDGPSFRPRDRHRRHVPLTNATK
jgi:hypothetical protein